MTVKAIPEGYTSLTPYLIVKGGTDAITYYQNAFNAVELMRMNGPDNKVGHAEMQIGNARFMLADEFPEMGFHSPQSAGSAGVSMLIYVENVDSLFQQALSAGGKQLKPLQDQFYGDRSGTLVDPFGHVWTVATHIADYSEEELPERACAAMKGQGQSVSAEKQ
ncbi:VOC family protein [Glaciimonas sp. PAMC28666]|uniref:VOC family protein n=1 Tax=Glaciimonas sp. PAMC28666 TaxID=2807626 RepID=UPI0019665CCC|nr:VOC family protein [Glaciimonas sp. PAMC28666]QRX82187.1 VOC family protein [Glaciimonas sp. PAMC28666]